MHHHIITGGPENISKGIEDYEAAGELETDEDAVKAIKMKIKKVVAAMMMDRYMDGWMGGWMSRWMDE